MDQTQRVESGAEKGKRREKKVQIFTPFDQTRASNPPSSARRERDSNIAGLQEMCKLWMSDRLESPSLDKWFTTQFSARDLELLCLTWSVL